VWLFRGQQILAPFIHHVNALLLRHFSTKKVPHTVVITPSHPLHHHIICLHVKHPLLIKPRNIHPNLSCKKNHFPIYCHCCLRYNFICPPLRIIHINRHFEKVITFIWAHELLLARVESSPTCTAIWSIIIFVLSFLSIFATTSKTRTT
jgi:hypothetical protein